MFRYWTTQYCYHAALLKLICGFNEISISILATLLEIDKLILKCKMECKSSRMSKQT